MAMISSEKNSEGPTSIGCLTDNLPVILFALFVVLQVFVDIFNHDNGRIDHGTNSNGNATKAHDIGIDTLPLHDDETDKDAYGQGDDADQGASQVEQKNDTDQGDDQALFDEGVF